MVGATLLYVLQGSAPTLRLERPAPCIPCWCCAVENIWWKWAGGKVGGCLGRYRMKLCALVGRQQQQQSNWCRLHLCQLISHAVIVGNGVAMGRAVCDYTGPRTLVVPHLRLPGVGVRGSFTVGVTQVEVTQGMRRCLHVVCQGSVGCLCGSIPAAAAVSCCGMIASGSSTV